MNKILTRLLASFFYQHVINNICYFKIRTCVRTCVESSKVSECIKIFWFNNRSNSINVCWILRKGRHNTRKSKVEFLFFNAREFLFNNLIHRKLRPIFLFKPLVELCLFFNELFLIACLKCLSRLNTHSESLFNFAEILSIPPEQSLISRR